MCDNSKLLFTGATWTVGLVEKMWKVIDKMAKEEYGLDYYDPRIEIVTASQMLYHHSMNAMPLMYNHWSFGKRFELSQRAWEQGKSSLAFETVINTNPMVCYILESNSATMQALVLAHANAGHGSFFKMNYMFQLWTDADAIVNELTYAHDYIKKCEKKYGEARVERILDAAHSLSLQSMDKYKRRRIPRESDVAKKLAQREKHLEQAYDYLLDDPETYRQTNDLEPVGGWPYPEENLLYFIEKNSPALDEWEREVIRIVRRSSQYFYPQMSTKVMNEGWASFWHYTLMERLNEEGYLGPGSMLEFYESHTAVCDQVDGAALNPYVLGFKIFMDLKRACENPTKEDYEYLPLVAGKPWLETLKWVASNFKDSDFLLEFLGPNVIKDLKLFSIQDNAAEQFVTVTAIQSNDDVRELRKKISAQYDLNNMLPDIEIVGCNFKGDRTLHVQYNSKNHKRLDPDTNQLVTKYLRKLWGYPIAMNQVDETGSLISCKVRKY